MSTNLRDQARRALVPVAAMALALAPFAASAQPAAPVQSAVVETIACPALPLVLLDYLIKGNLNLPQGWTTVNKHPVSG